jgi:hypothetical protein
MISPVRDGRIFRPKGDLRRNGSTRVVPALKRWAMTRRREDEANMHRRYATGEQQRRLLLTDDFHQRAFAAAAVEFAVEDLFPRA